MDVSKILRRIGLVLLCMSVMASFVYADDKEESQELKISLSQAPEAVRATIEKKASDSKIEVIEVEVQDGEMVFDVGIEKEGKSSEFKVALDGKFLGFEKEESAEAEEAEENQEHEIEFEQLPASVRDVAKKFMAEGSEIQVQEEKEDGVVYFEIEIEKGESSKSLKVTQDGALVEVEEEIELSDLPEAVRTKIEKKLPHSEVEEIVRVHAFYYEIAITKDGKEIEIPISPAGIVMKSEKNKREFKEKDKEDEDDEEQGMKEDDEDKDEDDGK